MRRSRRRSCPLDQAVAYRNAEVVARFCEAWDVPRADANKVFDDLKRYLWMCAQLEGETVSPIPIVDEMWHTFLMFTIDYRTWSERCFGRVIEHVPASSRAKRVAAQLARRSPARARAQAEKRLAAEVSTVYDLLGERTVRRWYVAYATRYGPLFFRRRRRPVGGVGASRRRAIRAA
jgi:hypothetical protein